MHNFLLSLIIKHFSLFIALILNIVLIFFSKKSSFFWLTVFFVFLALNIGFIILLSYFQYKVWQAHPISRYLLPPYTPFFYFLSYSYHHIYKDFLWSLIAAFLILSIMELSHSIFKKSLFYPEELVIVPILSSFLKWPFGFLFFFSGLLFMFFIHLSNLIKSKEKVFEKISLKDYWVFFSLFYIILNMYLEIRNPFIFSFIRP